MIPMYDTKTFSDVFPTVDVFLSEYTTAGIPATISEISAKTLYYLLLANYGNSPMANYDENQFKLKVFGLIFEYGPSWEKRLEIQQRLRNLTEEDILTGANQIYNHATNPDQLPTTQTSTELSYVNDQQVVKYRKSKLDGYGYLWELIKADVTNEFITKFKKLFLMVVKPHTTRIYGPYEEDDDDND